MPGRAILVWRTLAISTSARKIDPVAEHRGDAHAEETAIAQARRSEFRDEQQDELLARRGRLMREVDTLERETTALRVALEDQKQAFEIERERLSAEVVVISARHKAQEAEASLRQAAAILAAEEAIAKQRVAERAAALAVQRKESTDNEIAARQTRRADVEQQIFALSQESIRAQEQLAEVRAEATRTRATIENFNATHASVLGEIAKLEGEIAELVRQRDERAAEVKRSLGDIDALERDRRRLESSVESLIAAETRAGDRAAAATETMRAREAALAEITERQQRAAQNEVTTLERIRKERLDSLEEEIKTRRDTAASEVEATRTVAEADAAEARRVANDEKQRVIAEAQSLAAITKVQADRDARIVLDAAEAEYRRRTSEANSQVEELTARHRAQIEQLEARAQQEASAYVAAAAKSAAEVDTRVAEVMAEAKRGGDENRAAAETEKTALLAKAAEEAAQIRASAAADAEQVRAAADRSAALARERTDNQSAERQRELDAEFGEKRARAEAQLQAWQTEQTTHAQAMRAREIDAVVARVVPAVSEVLEPILQNRPRSGNAATDAQQSARAESERVIRDVEAIVRKVMRRSSARSSTKDAQKSSGGKSQGGAMSVGRTPANGHGRNSVQPGLKSKMHQLRHVTLPDIWQRFLMLPPLRKALFGAGAVLAVVLVLWTGSSTLSSLVSQAGGTRSAASGNATLLFTGSYTESVLASQQFVQREMDRGFQDRWAVSLNRFLQLRLDLDDAVAVRLIPVESSLVRRLAALRGQITPTNERAVMQTMRSAEREALGRMEALVGGPDNLARFIAFKREFHAESKP